MRRLATILKKVLHSTLRSKIVLNCSMLLAISSLGIHTPSTYLHYWGTFPPPPDYPVDLPKVLQKPGALFEDLIRYSTRAWGWGCSSWPDDLLDLFQCGFVDIKQGAGFGWEYKGCTVAEILLPHAVTLGVANVTVDLLLRAWQVITAFLPQQVLRKCTLKCQTMSDTTTQRECGGFPPSQDD